ncbi:hypothetical protein A2982_01855 [candidate division WWE3 bacterium RIFCSPLOWO2_01_FULL_39_13]|uniref:Glycosyltransferase 2-like domain-containing protein n=1 Tax=candidate division WWE3 bacterium RIFCSPLOWO2_01_FULL_39_13 TaxID=1802624 RepID=A0A1F4V3Y7_UNCKA|nr:MAG: hypothetical protein A2982_01855 [candidate division WWE3 bacterium RIFCSPLOWO2_01_FULL_39_13]
MYSSILIIIPAYNEEKMVGKVIDDLKKAGFENIIVIDDGSSDKTGEVSKKAGAIVLTHPVNIGVGGAFSTGMEYARLKNYKYLITVDADGQHNANDVKKIALELQKDEYDIVSGSRFLDFKRKYKPRYLLGLLWNLIIFLFTFKYTSDPESGLRGFNKKALEVINVESSGFEACSEIIIKSAKSSLKTKEIPVTAIYTDYSINKGQKITNATRLFRKLLLRHG